MSSTVILGAGIIGLSTAYYLSDHQPPSSVHLVDPSPELFASASGYAGGFLAEDWFVSQLSSLGALSYGLHRKLAAENGGREKWKYSSTTSVSYSPTLDVGTARQRGDDWLRHGTSRVQAAPDEVLEDGEPVGQVPKWLRRVQGDHIELISTAGSTAQLDPLLLCQFLLQECLQRGVRLHHPAIATSVSTDLRGELSSIRIADRKSSTETDLPCTRIIIAAGVWTPKVFKDLFRHSHLNIPVASLAGHSLVLRSPHWKGGEEDQCHAVYTTHGAGFSPEIYARVGGDIYIAGLNSATHPVPDLPDGTKTHNDGIERLKATARMLIGGVEESLEVVRQGLCHRPVTPWGNPILCRIPDVELGIAMATRPGADGGVFLATGHGPWGISLGLGTGKVLAELAQGRPTSADVSSLGMEMK